MIILVEGHGKYKTLGRTRDDAAGEAYDKVARFLNLGYPGGPIIDKMAKEGNPKAINFTRPMLDDGYDFSFSGIKTGVVNYVNKLETATTSTSSVESFSRRFLADLVASFQQAVVDVLVEKSVRAAKEFNCITIALAGGVSANSLLRCQLSQRGKEEGLTIHIPPFEYCTDNAAMIACAAYHKISDFYGYFRPVIKDVVEHYLDCGNPRCGFARVRCPGCGTEFLLFFSCRTRGFCPSCHAKRLEEWGEWMREELLLDIPHRQVVFVIPKMLRIFFKYKRRLLGELCQAAVQALLYYFQAVTGVALMPGVVAVIQTFGDYINFHPHVPALVSER